MRLLYFTLCLLVLLALASTKPCSGPRCKRMTNVMAKLYNDYDYGNGGYGGGYGSQRESDCPNCYATDFGNGDYNQNQINIEKK